MQLFVIICRSQTMKKLTMEFTINSSCYTVMVSLFNTISLSLFWYLHMSQMVTFFLESLNINKGYKDFEIKITWLWTRGFLWHRKKTKHKRSISQWYFTWLTGWSWSRKLKKKNPHKQTKTRIDICSNTTSVLRDFFPPAALQINVNYCDCLAPSWQM